MIEIPHSTELIREKWSKYRSQNTRIEFHGDFSGSIASCCMEFSTLDRLIYNLANNSVKYGEGGVVHMHMLPDTLPKPSNLLIAVGNEISNDQRSVLNEKFGNDFASLFQGGFTTRGTGLGLRICADCVGSAYGIKNISSLYEQKLIAARLTEHQFLVWFFWPAA